MILVYAARPEVHPSDQSSEGATSADAKPIISFAPKRRGKAPAHLADLGLAGYKRILKDPDLSTSRADQLPRHRFDHFGVDSNTMTDVPVPMQKNLTRVLLPELVTEVVIQRAGRGMTLKHLWRLFDGAGVGSVLMRYPGRMTLCVSS